MSIRRRLGRLEGALGPRPRMHLVNPTEWSAEEQVVYDEGTEEEREAVLRAYIPDLREGDIVVLSSIPRPEGED